MPQPIDPNTEFMRVAAAERIQQIADRASLAAQARTTDQADIDRTLLETQVREMNQKSEQVDEELRRRTPFSGKRKRRKKDEEEEAQDEAAHTFYTADEQKEIVEDSGDHGLDVTI